MIFALVLGVRLRLIWNLVWRAPRKRKGKDHGHPEKAVAARRAGCEIIIFPKDNMPDWLEDRLQGEKGTDQF